MSWFGDLTPEYEGEGQPEKASSSSSLLDFSGLFEFFEDLLGFPKTPEYLANVIETDTPDGSGLVDVG